MLCVILAYVPFALVTAVLVVPAGAQQPAWPQRQITVVAAGEPLPGEFSRIAGAALWPDGRVLVAEGSTGQVTLFDAQGRVRWVRGRSGGGPGEYRWIQGMVRCANDLIGVYDTGLSRFTFLGLDSGQVVHTRVEEKATKALLASCRNEKYVLAGVQSLQITKPPAPGDRFTGLLALRAFEGPAEPLATGKTELLMTSTAFTDFPFGERAVLADGGSAVYLCQTGAGSCTVVNATDGTTRSFTLALPRAEVTAAQWKQSKDARVSEMAGPPAAREQLARMVEEMPKPERFGAFETVRADAAGRLWVRTYRGYGESQATWLIVNQQGEPLASAVLPAGADPLAIGIGELIAQVRDADGAPQVQRYRFPPL